jgi:hypothetical protein
MLYYNKGIKGMYMNSLFKVKTADEIEDKLLKVIEKYAKVLQKEEAERGNMVGLNGMLFAKRAQEKIESMGIAISSAQIHMLKDSIATKQTDRMNEIVQLISKKSGLPDSPTAGRFKELNLGMKGDSRMQDLANTATKGNLMTTFPAIGIPLSIGYAAYKGIAALVNKASDMAYKSSLNKEVMALPVVEPRKNRNNMS